MSNLALFYDTETQGLPLFNEPSEDPRQPHIVQIGACLVDLDSRKTISAIDLIVKPEGWSIPTDVSAIHGITTDHAMAVGIPETIAMSALVSMWLRANVRIGHNELFDARIIRIALKRNEHTVDEAFQKEWKNGNAECTARLSTPILKLPPTEKMKAAGRFHHKTPNLGEAYKHFTGKELIGAHSAMVDVQACMSVYFSILDANNMEPQ